MLLRINHETKLTYSALVSENVFEVRMAPPAQEDQTVLGYRLRITPATTSTSYRDGFGNQVELFNVLPAHKEVVVRAMSFVRTHRRPGATRLTEIPWPVETPPIECMDFVLPSPLVDRSGALESFRAKLPAVSGSVAEVVHKLMEAVRSRLKYEKKVTTAWTPVSESLKLGCGVCQDFAHLFLAVCRGIGLPARYVSGYINHPGEIATHAWCQVWGGNKIGWVDVDPTRCTFVEDEHVIIGVGRDYADVSPNRGVWRGVAEETMTVTVKVEPVERMPSDWSELSGQQQAMWNGAMSQVQRGFRRGVLGAVATDRSYLRQQQSQQQQTAD